LIGCGGTTLNYDDTSFSITSVTSYESETSWSGSNGGYSGYFTRPSYQTGIHKKSQRGVPDLAANADPKSGYAICFTAFFSSECYRVGGRKFMEKNLKSSII